MKSWLLALLSLWVHVVAAQIDSLGNLRYNVGTNDIWGYVDENGNEYAIVGLRNGVSIVDVSVPNMPMEVYRDNGPETPWRDIKVFGDYAYVTDESTESDGLTIYNLTNLPGGEVVKVREFGGDQAPFKTAHNIWIDEKGRAFVVGTDRSKGMIVFDLNNDPENPTEIGRYDDYYFHDIYVENDTAYASLINDGDLMILDLVDMNNPTIISRVKTRERFTHNAWPGANHKYVYTTDETAGAEIGVFDISKANDPERIGGYQFDVNGVEMPHNVYVDDSIVWLAYYRTGIIALNGYLPDVLVEVDVFDTAPADSGDGGNGVWGVYPFLPSGTILASDMSNGLFTFGYTHQNAKYLRGQVVDSATTFPLSNVSYALLGSDQAKKTPLNGDFSIGETGNGFLNVVFSKQGYYPDTVLLSISLKEVVDTIIELNKIQTPEVNYRLVSVRNEPIVNGSATVTGVNWTAEYKTNSTGDFVITDLPLGTYTIYLGAFGYLNACYEVEITPEGTSETFELLDGIYDDFSANQGWETFAVKEKVRWERTTPIASFKNNGAGIQADPGIDAGGSDCGSFAFCTDIEAGVPANLSTVNFDNFLVSPKFKVVDFEDVRISIDYWLATEENGNDSLWFGFIDGGDTVYVDTLTSAGPMREWVNHQITLSSLSIGSDSVNFIVKITDNLEPWNVIDAAVDNFEVIYVTVVNELNDDPCVNLTSSRVQFLCGIENYQIFDASGRLVGSGYDDHVFLKELKIGMYFLKIGGKETLKILRND